LVHATVGLRAAGFSAESKDRVGTGGWWKSGCFRNLNSRLDDLIQLEN
jgi:hypothetical protein